MSAYRQAAPKSEISMKEIWAKFWARSLTHQEVKVFHQKFKDGGLPDMPSLYQEAITEEFLAREAICWTGRPTTPLEDM